MKWEIIRKSIHASGLSVPILYYATNRTVTVTFIGVFLLLFLLFDYFRMAYLQKIPIVGYFMKKITRKHEQGGLGAHVYFTAGALVVVFFLERNVAIASTLMLTFGDGLAAITGKSFGRIKIYGEKTLVGSLSCFICCLIIGYFFLGTPIAFVAAAVATVSELQDFINDNFAMPVFTGAVVQLLYFSDGII
ncbi:MAG: SEC59/DGK1/VTE5 family protein [Euryarchaeota archaeon]|nr:SEC59/DGK1/VTE5 family protein [Euryarchaeota archaeon]